MPAAVGDVSSGDFRSGSSFGGVTNKFEYDGTPVGVVVDVDGSVDCRASLQTCTLDVRRSITCPSIPSVSPILHKRKRRHQRELAITFFLIWEV